MKRVSAFLLIAFVLGCLATTAVSGCSKAADRTLTIYQLQSMETYGGQFAIDSSGLPSNAIESIVETDSSGDPVKRITLNMDYEFEIVLRLVGTKENALSVNPNSNPN